LETDRQILTCQSTPCTKEIQLSPSTLDPYFETKQGFSYGCQVLENNDGNVTGYQCTVNHQSGLMSEASLRVKKERTVGWNQICDINVTSSGETMVCQFNETAEGNTYQYSLKASKDGFTYTLDAGTLDYGKGLFTGNAEFAALMVFLTFSMLGLISPSTAIVFSTAGILFSLWMGLITVSLGAAGSLVVVAALVMLGGTS